MECEKLFTLTDAERVVVVMDFLEAAMSPTSDKHASEAEMIRRRLVF